MPHMLKFHHRYSNYIKTIHIILLQGSIAYVPQQAWIQNMSLRENILFTKPYIENKYDEILTNCQLQDDLKIFIEGDMIEIGERVRISFLYVLYKKPLSYIIV